MTSSNRGHRPDTRGGYGPGPASDRDSCRPGHDGLVPLVQLDDCLRKEWHQCRQEEAPISLVAAEIDNVDHLAEKDANDFLGAAAHRIRALCLRRRDCVFARDKNTILAVLPATPTHGARHIAHRANQALHGLRTAKIPLPKDNAPVISVGAAVEIPTEDRDPFHLLERSKMALDAARQHGRPIVFGFSGHAEIEPLVDFSKLWRNVAWKLLATERRSLRAA